MSDPEKPPPGLVWRKRNGPPAAYWLATPAAIKAGYTPKSVRLHHEAGDPLLGSRCHVLQAEMLTWLADCGKGRPALYNGTFASLVRYYETHPDSPYFELKPKTQVTYSNTLKLLMANKGARMVRAVDGADVKRWYKELCEASSVGWAYYTINVLKAVLSFGATKRFKECRLLRTELREAIFRNGPRRKHRLTFEQVTAFRQKAHEMNLGWMALTVTFQWAFAVRRRDVIGEWLKTDSETIGVRYRNKVWRDGFTWDHIDEAGVFRKLISKTEFSSGVEAAHTIADYPELVEELALVETGRIGPIVIDSRTGLPPNDATCRRYFRIIGRACGIPDEVWNMDARAGANTEAYEGGATKEESMAMMTHTQESTNRGYLRDLREQSHRAAVKRVGSRGPKEERKL